MGWGGAGVLLTAARKQQPHVSCTPTGCHPCSRSPIYTQSALTVLSGLKRKERAYDAEELGEELEVKECPACEFHQNT